MNAFWKAWLVRLAHTAMVAFLPEAINAVLYLLTLPTILPMEKNILRIVLVISRQESTTGDLMAPRKDPAAPAGG